MAMTQVTQRRLAVAVLTCLLILSFGWPIIGAVRGLFWGHEHHGGPRIDAIGRVLDAAFDSDLYPPQSLRALPEERYGLNRFPDPGPNCEQLAEARVETLGDDLLTASSNINEAIYRLRRDEYRGAVRKSAIFGVEALPDFWIGAIDGCISGSMLAPLCTGYVVEKLAGIRVATEKELRQSFARANDRAEQAWCLSIGDLVHARNPVRTPKSGSKL